MKIAVVGASGAVGQEFLRVFGERNFKFDDMVLFGSARSAGRTYSFGGKDYVVKELKHNDDFAGVDIAFVSAGGGVSKEFAETITKHGAVMIDNSSAFRMDSDVPLVVPEVNAADALVRPRGIIANPNCTTILLVVVLNPIERLSHIRRVRVSTYQAASGAGSAAMDELVNQCRQSVSREETTVSKFMRAHSESVWIETEAPLDVEAVRQALAAAPGVVLCDVPAEKKYPMPLFMSGADPVSVGRIRRDIADDCGLTLWLCGDQIKKGAALNAVQIAEWLRENDPALKNR